MTERNKPEGVPADAWFHEEWGEWIEGEKRGDARVGEWKQWHATEGHVTCIDVYDDEGRLTQSTRFHPDGTFSQQVSYDGDQPHGLGVYQRSTNPSQERSMQTAPEAAFRMELYWVHGKQPMPARFFDKDGNEISATGDPKPVGLPEQARSDTDGRWLTNQAVLQDDYEGVDTVWRTDGTLMLEQRYEDQRLVLQRRFHPDGSPASELDYRAKTGWCRGTEGETDVELAEMPGDACEVRFRIDIVNAKTGLYWSRDQTFLDADGNTLSGRGFTVHKPHPDAWVVTDGSWHQPKTYWCHVEEAGRRRESSYWRQEGTLAMKATYEAEHLVGFSRYADDGTLEIEESFYPRTERKRPVNRAVTVTLDDGRVEIECDEEGRCTTFRRYEGDELAETIESSEPGELGIETFEAEFERRFGALLRTRGVEVWLGFFTLSHLGVERFDEFFDAAVVAGDGAGNEVVVVLEGKHAGKVYFLDHEEGLYALECVDEFIEEEGIDAAEMSKDALVEAMPFFENELAGSLGELLRETRVNAHTTFYGRLAEFRRTDAEA